jgi:ABC-2 type transport system ATP-binding protein
MDLRPPAGVDPLSRREFWTMFYSLARSGLAIIVTTHCLNEAENANRIGMIHIGVVQALGTPAERKDNLRGEVLRMYCDEQLNVIRDNRSAHQGEAFAPTRAPRTSSSG